jgi:NADH-quinone oxidoreductase subunit N
MIALFLASLIPLTVKVLRGNREQSPIITLSQALIGIVVSIGLLMVFGGAGKTAFRTTSAIQKPGLSRMATNQRI